jgi:CheY-like chemotaxis protein
MPTLAVAGYDGKAPYSMAKPSIPGIPPLKASYGMARVCCLASIEPEKIADLGAALKGAGESALVLIGHLEVAELSKIAPDILIVDIDRLEVDRIEMLRRLRFVLPECVIAVYSAKMLYPWSRECHLAGASCLLSKQSTVAELSRGLRIGIRGGCYTDPRFAA